MGVGHLKPPVPFFLRQIFQAVIDAIFPLKCLVCGRFFHLPDVVEGRKTQFNAQIKHLNDDRDSPEFEKLLAVYLCSVCTKNFVSIESPFCSRCGIMFKGKEGDDHVCGDCLTSPGKFRLARAPVVYDKVFMNIIHRFKYSGKVQLSKPLGALLLAAFCRNWDTADIDLVIPVPLHNGRFKKRGFNQSFLLVQNWKKMAPALKIELSHVQIEKDVLVRIRPTVPQIGLGRKERLANIENAFGVRGPEKIEGKRILLIDDVYTTGATADECARVLLNDGAEYVDVLTVARSL